MYRIDTLDPRAVGTAIAAVLRAGAESVDSRLAVLDEAGRILQRV